MSYSELESSPTYSVYIFYADIQLIYQSKKNCSSDENSYTKTNSTIKKNSFSGYNISFINNILPLCIDTETNIDIYPNNKAIFDASNLAVEWMNTDIADSITFLDTLAFSSSRLNNCNVLRIYNTTNLSQLKAIFDAKDILSGVIVNTNIYTTKINKLIEVASSKATSDSDSNVNNTINKNSTNVTNNSNNKTSTKNENTQSFISDFIDDQVMELVISTYFIDQDIKKLGLVLHKYQSNIEGVSTQIENYGLEINQLEESDTNFFELIYMASIFVQIIFTYLKYLNTRDINDTVNKSLFLIITVQIFIFESIFKFFHMLKGTNNAFFTPTLVYKVQTRDRFLFYKENIKLFKGLTVLSISFHLIFVIFSQKDLTIIRKLFKRVVVVFLVTISILIMVFSVFLHLMFGSIISDYTTLLNPFTLLFAYLFGVETGSEINEKTNKGLLYIQIILYFIRLFVLNFILVVMILVFQQFMKKQEIEKQKEKNQFKND